MHDRASTRVALEVGIPSRWIPSSFRFERPELSSFGRRFYNRSMIQHNSNEISKRYDRYASVGYGSHRDVSSNIRNSIPQQRFFFTPFFFLSTGRIRILAQDENTSLVCLGTLGKRSSAIDRFFSSSLTRKVSEEHAKVFHGVSTRTSFRGNARSSEH